MTNELGSRSIEILCCLGQSQEKKKEAVDEFIKFIESIPEEVGKNPKLIDEEFPANLVKVGIGHEWLDDMGRIYPAVAHVLVSLKYKRSNIDVIGSAKKCLREFIRGGQKGPFYYDATTRKNRDEALKLYCQLHNEMPEATGTEDLIVVTKANVQPFRTDVKMVEDIIFRLEKNRAENPNAIAEIVSRQSNKTLVEMIKTNPDYKFIALEVLDAAEKSVEAFCFENMPFKRISPEEIICYVPLLEEVRLIAMTAADMTCRTIEKASQNTPVPERRAPGESDERPSPKDFTL